MFGAYYLEYKLHEDKDFVLFTTISPRYYHIQKLKKKKSCYMNEWMNEHNYCDVYTHHLQLV